MLILDCYRKSLPVFAAGCRYLPAFDTAVPNSGFAIRASLPDFLCPGCRSFGSLYLPVVLTSPFVDAALQATGSSLPLPLQTSLIAISARISRPR
ncbi:hypothetical protein TNIN_355771 [Trichonephila inaurata madagascariensis]|uniref:Uncharacterized protein n=1 Tax=Trichonephila inaurata madagascariensis TaxID=2747483 RepID=A0A8X6YC70_9ARAC|nr:hypothetical protein TNIN_355771 [Trichonephila inaurata madagascariensis]